MDKILEFIKSKQIKQLYVIGGDGTHRGAFKIHETCMEKVSKNKFYSALCCRCDFIATY